MFTWANERSSDCHWLTTSRAGGRKLREPDDPGRVTPNARRQAPPRAGATEERRLLAVACTPLLGPAVPPTPGLSGPPLPPWRLPCEHLRAYTGHGDRSIPYARPSHHLTPAAAGRTTALQGHDATATPGPLRQATLAWTTLGQEADRPPEGHRAGQSQATGRHGHAQTTALRPRATDHAKEGLWCHREGRPSGRYAHRTPVDHRTWHR